MRLCIDIGTDYVKCGFFQNQHCIKNFQVQDLTELQSMIQNVRVESIILVCNNSAKSQEWIHPISLWGIAIKTIDPKDFQSRVAPSDQELLLPDTIAKIYGALSYHPINDCLVIDFGSTIRYELISKQGLLLGRSIFPSFKLLDQSLNVPLFHFEDQVPAPLGIHYLEAVNGGCFFGVLGAVERMISEIRLCSPHPSELITLATGALTEKACWKDLVGELVDYIYPHLILEGLNQILNEGSKP